MNHDSNLHSLLQLVKQNCKMMRKNQVEKICSPLLCNVKMIKNCLRFKKIKILFAIKKPKKSSASMSKLSFFSKYNTILSVWTEYEPLRLDFEITVMFVVVSLSSWHESSFQIMSSNSILLSKIYLQFR